MTNKKMEQRLASALEKTAPDDVSGVLSRCEVRKGVTGCKPQHRAEGQQERKGSRLYATQ